MVRIDFWPWTNPTLQLVNPFQLAAGFELNRQEPSAADELRYFTTNLSSPPR